MDLSFNQFSLTERLGLFSEKEVQQLLICGLIASQLAFLNWLGGVLYDAGVGQYPVRSQQHSDPRFQVAYIMGRFYQNWLICDQEVQNIFFSSWFFMNLGQSMCI